MYSVECSCQVVSYSAVVVGWWHMDAHMFFWVAHVFPHAASQLHLQWDMSRPGFLFVNHIGLVIWGYLEVTRGVQIIIGVQCGDFP